MSEVWFDGANGEGQNGKVQIYNWERYYQIIRALQPNVVIVICGPDVRWIGNEAGKSRKNEWSVVLFEYSQTEYTSDLSQQSDDITFREQYQSMDEVLGSTEKLLNNEGDLICYPAEVDTSIRPGWFYHSNEDNQVRSVNELFHIYLHSVGENTTLLLNVPQTPEGLISSQDVEVLTALDDDIRALNEQRNVYQAILTVSSGQDDLTLFDVDQPISYWSSCDDDKFPTLKFEWDKAIDVNFVRLKVYLPHSQRVEQILVEAFHYDELVFSVESGVIGCQKILSIPKSPINTLKITFKQFRGDHISINGIECGCSKAIDLY